MNSEQLLFNWQLGRDLVVRKAEEKWGNGIVEQVSLDLQAAFPEAKGFSARNLWNMKKWYSFYTSYEDFGNAVNALRGPDGYQQLKTAAGCCRNSGDGIRRKTATSCCRNSIPGDILIYPLGTSY